jgi:outer membrane lipoprotein LolB
VSRAVTRAPRFFLAVSLLAGMLTGCATSEVQQRLPDSNAALRDFTLDGRIAVKVEAKGYSANLKWRHQGEADSVRLLTPVGTTLAQLDAGPGGAQLVGADKKVYRSDDVESLTREILGWDLPLQGLQHWVLGRPDPGLPVAAEERDARNRLVRFSQNGWQIAYQAFAGDGVLPQRMTLARDSLRLRLLIDRWDVGG